VWNMDALPYYLLAAKQGGDVEDVDKIVTKTELFHFLKILSVCLAFVVIVLIQSCVDHPHVFGIGCEIPTAQIKEK